MSALSQFAGGAVRNIQTGYVTGGASGSGTPASEDTYYWDVTIDPVTNIDKCVIQFDGSASNDPVSVGTYFSPGSGGLFLAVYIPTAIVLNTTTLRLMARDGEYIAGRWTLIEYK